MRAVIGTHNVDNCSRLCHAPSARRADRRPSASPAARTAPTTSSAPTASCSPAPTPTEAHPVVGARIKQARAARRGPGRRRPAADRARPATPTCICAGRPGSNVARLQRPRARAARRGARRRGASSPSAPTASRSCSELLADYPPERVQEISGVPAEDLRPGGAPVRRGRQPGDRLRAGRHRAHARHRRRAHAVEPGDPDRQRRHRRGAAASTRCAGQNNVQGASDIGRAARPAARLPEGRQTRRRASASSRPGASRCQPEPGLRIPRDVQRRARRGAEGALRHRRGHRADRPRHRRTCRRRSTRASSSICQEIFLSRDRRARRRGAAGGASLLEKDGTFVNFDRRFQRVRPALAAARGRAAPTSRSSTLVAAGAGRRPGLPDSRRRDGRVRAAGAAVRRHLTRPPGPRRRAALALPSAPTTRARRALPATVRDAERAAPSWPRARTCRRARRPTPATRSLLITGPAAGALQRGHDDPPHRQPRARVRGAARDPSPTTRCGSGCATATPVEVTSRRGPITVAAEVTERVAPGQAVHGLPLPRGARQRAHVRAADEVTSCPEYKVTAVKLAARERAGNGRHVRPRR